MSEFALALLVLACCLCTAVWTRLICRRQWKKEHDEKLCFAIGSQTFMPTVIAFDDEAIEDLGRLNALRLDAAKKMLREEIARIEAGNGGELIAKSMETAE